MTTRAESRLQGASDVVIDAPADRVWELLVDSQTNLPRIWPMVKSCRIDAGGKEREGAQRRCDVELEGKTGWTIERCLECVPGQRLVHSIESDSFGFSKHLRDFWFSFELAPAETGGTVVRVETHYEPRNLLATLMSVLAIRKKFRTIRETALANLKRLAEESRSLSISSSPFV